MPFFSPRLLALLLATVLAGQNGFGEPVPVRQPQGSVRGFLEIRTLNGERIATGDYAQSVHGDRVTDHVTFHFKDGSIDDETSTFSQRNYFRLISDHHIQHGPSFPDPIDVFIDAITGQITSRASDGTTTQDHLDLPADVCNGIQPNLVTNLLPSTSEIKLSFVAPTAKPRLVRISIKPAGEVSFKIGATTRKATDYVLHIELGGITGIIAPIIGKQPADSHMWVVGGKVPAFIREEGQLYEGGPIWSIQQISPVFSRHSAGL
jgi:hypothetical protein